MDFLAELKHSWGDTPEQKAKEKQYNHEYYEKHKAERKAARKELKDNSFVKEPSANTQSISAPSGEITRYENRRISRVVDNNDRLAKKIKKRAEYQYQTAIGKTWVDKIFGKIF